MTWTPVESSDVVAIGFEPAGEQGTMGIKFHRPPGSTYVYFNVPVQFYQEFLAAPSKGKFVNFVIKHSNFAYAKMAPEGA